jgi:hypothetical protein
MTNAPTLRMGSDPPRQLPHALPRVGMACLRLPGTEDTRGYNTQPERVATSPGLTLSPNTCHQLIATVSN